MGAIAVILFICVALVFSGCTFLNDYQDTGNVDLPGLTAPVKVVRDEKGMPYIYAQNLDDAVMAQGFVTAQDRLFQMEVSRLFTQGRICELAGEKAKTLDIRNRTIGFYRNAVRQSEMLAPELRHILQKYVDGVNAYTGSRKDTHHLEFKLAGIQPQEWAIEDSLAILFYLSWNSAANLETEIISQMLVDKIGFERAKTIFPLNINPDAPATRPQTIATAVPAEALNLGADTHLTALLKERPLKLGSNNWAVSPEKAVNGKPIVASDPHLDARTLPGPWYPCGLIWPGHRVVGCGFPGLFGMLVFRNEHIALGVTNAYGDAQDLYVETLDPNNPNHYLEGNLSLPFEIIQETLTIKDKQAPDGIRRENASIRLTKRGPVVSHVFPGLNSNKVISLRWAPFETMQPQLGYDKLLLAASVSEVHDALENLNSAMLNFSFGDKNGNIGWRASGKLPVRSQQDGTVPFVVTDSRDNWIGWIPFDDMPHQDNPQKGWVGTCNQYVVDDDYPYYYSSYASPSYRYRRLTQLLDKAGKTSSESHWQYQRDTLNLMAAVIAPLMEKALAAHPDTAALSKILAQWDYHDTVGSAAPTIFQATYRQVARLTFTDELGEPLAETMLGNWYYWQERLQQLVLENDLPWFDDITTPDRIETRDEIMVRAALLAVAQLKEQFGASPDDWQWGKVHAIEFIHPIRREGFGKKWVGGGSHAVGGSAETLLRNYYDFNKPFDVVISASLRMVADLSDAEKVLAVLPGGVSGRLFHPHEKDQIQSFINGEKVFWWFSDEAILAHARTTLMLNP
jgi:penicillin amidase